MLGTNRIPRSLESKWGQIKHHVGEFVGCYTEVTRNKPTGTCVADILHLAKVIFKFKNSKNSDFSFKHCWLLVQEFPCWIDRWSNMRTVPPSKWRASPTQYDRGSLFQEEGSGVESNADLNLVLQKRSGVSRAMKAALKVDRLKEGGAHQQVEATKVLAKATLAKDEILKEKNLLILMTTPEFQVSGVALRFLRMHQNEEIEKYEEVQVVARIEKERL